MAVVVVVVTELKMLVKEVVVLAGQREPWLSLLPPLRLRLRPRLALILN